MDLRADRILFVQNKLPHKFSATSSISVSPLIIMAPTKKANDSNTSNVANGSNSSFSTPPSSPTKAKLSHKKPFSPTRKVGGMICTMNTAKPKMDIYQLTIINCGLGPVFPVLIEKEEGKGIPYNVPNLRRLSELDQGELDRIGVLGTYFRRDATDADKPMVVVNVKLSEYNVDMILLNCENILRGGAEATMKDYSATTSKLASVLNQISKQSEAAGEYKYGAPLYVNKGIKTSAGGSCLYDYFMTYDCIKIMKQFCDGVETKADLMMHKDRDNILDLIFGDTEKGDEVVMAIDEMIYNTL